MKKTYIILYLLMAVHFTSHCQTTELIPLSSFNKIVASPMIDLVISEGKEESIRLESEGRSVEEVEFVVRGNVLRIYLPGAKVTAKKKRYRGRSDEQDVLFDRPSYNTRNRIKAYVTYVDLKGLQIRGQNKVDFIGKLSADHFKLKAYGGARVNFKNVYIDRLKVSLYGDHNIKIDSGVVKKQIYLAYGDNRVDAQALRGSYARTHFYGDNSISTNVRDIIIVSSLGEVSVYYNSNPYVRRGIVIGEMEVRRLR